MVSSNKFSASFDTLVNPGKQVKNKLPSIFVLLGTSACGQPSQALTPRIPEPCRSTSHLATRSPNKCSPTPVGPRERSKRCSCKDQLQLADHLIRELITRILVALLGGSWVVLSGVIIKVTILITHMKGLITLLITTHEPPSKFLQWWCRCRGSKMYDIHDRNMALWNLV